MVVEEAHSADTAGGVDRCDSKAVYLVAGLSCLSRSSNQTNETDQGNQMNQLRTMRREMGSGIFSCLDSSGPFGSVADFQTIATGILEKDSVVARPFVISRAFDIPSSRPDDDLSQPIHLSGAVCPEGDPALVGDMPRRLSDAKKLTNAVLSGRFKLQPAFDPHVECEPQCRQKCFVEGLRLGQTAHPQVNVIVTSPHQWSSQGRDYSKNRGGVESGGYRRHARANEINAGRRSERGMTN